MMNAQFIGKWRWFCHKLGIESLSNLGVSFHGGRDKRIGGYLIHSLSNFELIGDDKRWESSRMKEYSQNPMKISLNLTHYRSKWA